MLSVSAMGGGQEAYYLDLAREDYYLEGGEPPGRWLGSLAETLGLRGVVTGESLGNVLEGRAPDGGCSLVQQQTFQDGRQRQPGWDLTFSAPKSVSVLWSQVEQDVRQAIQEIHFSAVASTLRYIEENAAVTRRGRGGQEVEPAGLVAAVFEHGTSRAQDPQLHSHVLIPNLALRSDGSFGTLRSRDLYQHQMVAGAYYRAELCRGLSARLGVSCRAVDRWFEIDGIPESMIETFSKRRAAILEAMAESGAHGAKAAEMFTLSTREVKAHVAREDLLSAWRQTGREQGFSAERIIGVPRQEPIDHEQAFSALQRISRQALADVTRTQSHFLERELLRMVFEKSQHLGLGGDLALASVRALLRDVGRVHSLGVSDGLERFTTPAIVMMEESLLSLAEASRNKNGAAVPERAVRRIIDDRASMREEQAEALKVLTDGVGSVKCLVGMAGTGKTFLLDAAREAWEERGFTVIGAALAAKAAGGLTKGARISSRTIESLIGRIDWGRDKGQELLDAKTVLVVDEAGMVDTRRMEKLLSETARAGATLILVGDHQQLQPIDAGGPFAALVKNLGAVKLREIIRQREEWMREAVHQFAAGDARGGLSRYAEAGMLDVAESKTEAIERLIATWAEQRSNDLKETLILAGTNADVDALNDLAQAARFRAGELVQDKVCFVGKTRFFAGDRVVFGRNDRTLGVVNGDFGIVEDVVVTPILGRTRLLVRLDREETGKLPFGRRTPAPLRVTVADPAETQLRLAYAVTTHKAQGATVDRSFVLAGGWMQDRELSYVQMSRAREKTWVFTSESDAGEDLCMLTAAMSRTRAKTLASVLVSQPAASRRNDLRLSH